MDRFIVEGRVGFLPFRPVLESTYTLDGGHVYPNFYGGDLREKVNERADILKAQRPTWDFRVVEYGENVVHVAKARHGIGT